MRVSRWICSFLLYLTMALSGSESGFSVAQSQMPLIPRKSTLHPRFDPRRVQCSYCHQTGHSLMNCPDRFRHHQRMVRENCVEGWHKPHLHDNLRLWRCEWCLMHLHEEYVKENYADTFRYERQRLAPLIRRNLEKYSSSTEDEA